MARAERGGPAAALPGRALLGPAAAGGWGFAGRDRDRRVGAGRTRGEPDGPDLHRRPLRGLAVRGSTPCGAREPAQIRERERWAAPTRRLRHGGEPLPTASEPADHGGAGQLPAISGPGAAAAGLRAGPRRARLLRLDRITARARGARGRGATPTAALRAWGGGRDPDGRADLVDDRLLSPEPAEHVHGQADRADDGLRVRAGEGAGRPLSR